MSKGVIRKFKESNNSKPILFFTDFSEHIEEYILLIKADFKSTFPVKRDYDTSVNYYVFEDPSIEFDERTLEFIPYSGLSTKISPDGESFVVGFDKEIGIEVDDSTGVAFPITEWTEIEHTFDKHYTKFIGGQFIRSKSLIRQKTDKYTQLQNWSFFNILVEKIIQSIKTIKEKKLEAIIEKLYISPYYELINHLFTENKKNIPQKYLDDEEIENILKQNASWKPTHLKKNLDFSILEDLSKIFDANNEFLFDCDTDAFKAIMKKIFYNIIDDTKNCLEIKTMNKPACYYVIQRLSYYGGCCLKDIESAKMIKINGSFYKAESSMTGNSRFKQNDFTFASRIESVFENHLLPD